MKFDDWALEHGVYPDTYEYDLCRNAWLNAQLSVFYEQAAEGFLKNPLGKTEKST